MTRAAAVLASQATRPAGRMQDAAAPSSDACPSTAPALTGADASALERMARELGIAALASEDLHRAAEALSIALPEGGEVSLLSVGRIAAGPIVAVPAEARQIEPLRRLLAARPERRERIRLVDPAALAAAAAALARRATRRPLAPVQPSVSTEAALDLLAALSRRAGPLDARRVLTSGQSAAAAVLALAAVAVAITAPGPLFGGLAVVASILFVGLAAVRIAAAGFAATAAYEAPRRRLPPAALPTYTVLVPLLREARVVPRLVAGLRALRYPPDRLDVKLLVEAHDTETYAELLRYAAGSGFEVVVVPPAGPQTKPKALNIGLALARGHLVTIYDAEDRPEPDQLWAVAEVFAAAAPELACVQARLAIDHADDTWITRMFAVEYAMLFDRLLPWLAARGLPFLLGGTSNHFRRTALLAIGGWDAWNVTEDADLALRLARRGYTSTVVASTTYEEAPLTLRAWLRQRTRWYKGWLQTWLVHARDPLGLTRRAGWAAFLMLQLQLAGTPLTVAAHPVFCLVLVGYLLGVFEVGGDGTFIGDVGLCTALVSLLAGYAAAAALARVAIRDRRLGFGCSLLAGLPLYWLLLAVALAAAVRDLVRRPHHWAKTEHGLARRPRALTPSPALHPSPAHAVQHAVDVAGPSRARPIGARAAASG